MDYRLLASLITYIGIIIFCIYIYKNYIHSLYFENKKKQQKIIVGFILILVLVSITSSFISNYLNNANYWLIIYNTLGAFLNFDKSIETDNVLVQTLSDIARMTAILSTASFIGGEFFSYILRRNQKLLTIRKYKKIIAVYTDYDEDSSFIKKIHKDGYYVVVIKDNYDFYNNTEYNLIIFQNDSEGINFYAKYKDKFLNKKVTLVLNEYDSSSLNQDEVKILNISQLIAKDYWLSSHSLIQYFDSCNDNKHLDIAIIGLNNIGKDIFKTAILNNIYSTKQQINYHLWGNINDFESINYDINGSADRILSYDKIIYHEEYVLNQKSLNCLNKCQRIIICDSKDSYVCQEIIRKNNNANDIHLYDNDLAILMSVTNNINSMNVSSFGSFDNFFSFENMFEEDKELLAKKINMFYQKEYNPKANDLNEEWYKIDGYSKRSCIACADYSKVRKLYLKDNKVNGNIDSILCELEHNRWCRFMIIEGYSYDSELEKLTKKRDAINKKHGCLVPFDRLSDYEKLKDLNVLKYIDNED